MATTFSASLQICGLSQQDAADYLDVRLDSVKAWSDGRTSPPREVWRMLADLYLRIEDTADYASSMLEPGLMEDYVLMNIAADSGLDPLPGSADAIAGAMALLIALTESD